MVLCDLGFSLIGTRRLFARAVKSLALPPVEEGGVVGDGHVEVPLQHRQGAHVLCLQDRAGRNATERGWFTMAWDLPS